MIYVFHKVGDSPVSGDPWWLSTKTFTIFIESLSRVTPFVYLEDYLFNNRVGNVLTFDDGYKCVLEEAVPLLKERAIPFEMFVTFGYVGKTNAFDDKDWGGIPMLDYEDLFKIMKAGGRIQHHTWTHTRLTYLNCAQIIREFERPIGFEPPHCQYISYPYGAFNKDVVAIAKLCFSGGLSVRDGRDDRYELLRTEISGGTFLRNTIEPPPNVTRTIKRYKEISSTVRQVDGRWPKTKRQ
jgi:peptidoglycan/xylan/chitin deacetylase (PgdA/CDA1 family)